GKNAEHFRWLSDGLGDAQKWVLPVAVTAQPGPPVSANVLRKDKDTKDGELVRIDVPWSILLQGDATGKGISAPADNALGAMDLAVDASDPTAHRSSAARFCPIPPPRFPNRPPDPP